MKKKSAWLVMVFIVFSIVGGAIIYHENVKRLDETKILVPKDDIQPNTQITKEMLTTKSVKAYYLPAGTILNEAMVGKYSKSTLYKGREILPSELLDVNNADNSLGFNLAAGERVVSVTVDNAGSIGGLLQKGQYVDVSWIRDVQVNNVVENIIVPIQSHIEILDVRSRKGATISAQDEGADSGSKIKIMQTAKNAADEKDQLFPLEVVLRVTVDQRQKIELAEASGKISLALNPNLPNDTAEGGIFTTYEMEGARNFDAKPQTSNDTSDRGDGNQ